MLKCFKSKHCSLLGVDISSASIKIMEISHYRGQLIVEKYSYRRLSSTPDKLSHSINVLLTKINSNSTFAAIAVPDSAVINKTIQLADTLNAIEMEQFIILEANKCFEYPSSRLNIDFVVLGPAKNSPGMMDILLIASKENNIQKHVGLLNDSGIQVKIAAIESQVITALMRRLITKLGKKDAQTKAYAVIYINDESLYFSVFTQETILYTRTEAFGIRQLEEQIVSYYKMSIEEVMLRRAAHQNFDEYELLIVKPYIHSLILKINESLELFFTSYQYSAIEHFFLTGDLRELTDLAAEIQKKTGILTTVANPISDITISKSINLNELTRLIPLFTLAFGLALRLVNEF